MLIEHIRVLLQSYNITIFIYIIYDCTLLYPTSTVTRRQWYITFENVGRQNEKRKKSSSEVSVVYSAHVLYIIILYIIYVLQSCIYNAYIRLSIITVAGALFGKFSDWWFQPPPRWERSFLRPSVFLFNNNIVVVPPLPHIYICTSVHYNILWYARPGDSPSSMLVVPS